jgi:hypothetical protein
MIRTLAVSVLLLTSPLSAQEVVKWTGWLSDMGCARITPGELPRPNGTACVKKCLDEGSPAVFISEQARAIYEVRGFPSAKDNVGYYLEINAEVDQKAKRINVKTAKRLSEVTAACLIPRKLR